MCEVAVIDSKDIRTRSAVRAADESGPLPVNCSYSTIVLIHGMNPAEKDVFSGRWEENMGNHPTFLHKENAIPNFSDLRYYRTNICADGNSFCASLV